MDQSQAINAVSGALAGAITATFVCPLDVLKTRLQIQKIGSGMKGGIIGGLSSIVKVEGFRGLYSGLSPTLMALLPNWAVYFTMYERLKVTLTNKLDGSFSGATPLVHMTAAATAGAATLVVTNPFWLVKTRLQTQTMAQHLGPACSIRKYTGAFDALFRITREEGMRGLYSGLAPSMAGVFHVAIQFPLYEWSKATIMQHPGRNNEPLTATELIVSSALCKMVASTATYPHEVVRSYMHVSGSGPLSGLKDVCCIIYREDGLRGFYRGCGTNLLRTTPAAAVTFTSFELIARLLRTVAAGGAGNALAETGPVEIIGASARVKFQPAVPPKSS